MLSILFCGGEREVHGASSPCTASVDEARRHMDQGLAFFDRKKYREAAVEFDAAYGAQPYSAFLCNAAMAYQAALDFPSAIARYKAFLAAEPNPPDLQRIKSTLAWLEAQLAAQIASQPDGSAETSGDAGPLGPADGGPGGASGAGAEDANTPAPLRPSIRSQVVIESEPRGAPLSIYAKRAGAVPFREGSSNPGWEKVVSGVKTPFDTSLGIGDYHIVLDAFQDYKRSETDLQLLPGRVYSFKANLSQGTFLGFLRVFSPVEGASIFLDDPPPHKKGPWGRAPHSDLLDAGDHQIWVEAPGFQPFSRIVNIEHGKTVEITAALERVSYGYLRIDGNAEGLAIKVDGIPYGAYSLVGDPLRIRLPAGRHLLELDASGYKTFKGILLIPRGQELAVHGRLSQSPPRGGALMSGALAIGAAVGGVFLLRQPSYELEFDSLGRPIPIPTGTQPWFKIGGFAALGVSGLLVFATGYTLLTDPFPPSRIKTDAPKEFDAPPAPRPPAPKDPRPPAPKDPRPPAPKKTGIRLDGIAPLVSGKSGGLQIQGSF